MTYICVENSEGILIKELPLDIGKTLLKQLESAWVEIPNACRTWMCAACLCNIVQWWEYLIKDFRWEPAFPLGEDEVMTCIAGVKETDEKIILRTIS